MTDAEKPFVCYKSGWSMQIMPRNAAGWRAFAWWLAAFFALTGLFAWFAKEEASEAKVVAMAIGYSLAAVGWAVAMIFWMKARSEIVDMDELLKLRREQDNARRLGRSRRP